MVTYPGRTVKAHTTSMGLFLCPGSWSSNFDRLRIHGRRAGYALRTSLGLLVGGQNEGMHRLHEFLCALVQAGFEERKRPITHVIGRRRQGYRKWRSAANGPSLDS